MQYENLPRKMPYIAIKHILEKLNSPKLKERTKDIIRWRKDVDSDKKDFDAFMRAVAEQAEKLQHALKTAPMIEKGEFSDEKGSPRKQVTFKHKSHRAKRFYAELKGSSNVTPKVAGRKKQRVKCERSNDEQPPCLDPACRVNGRR